MEKDKIEYQQGIRPGIIKKIKAELSALDSQAIDVGGVQLKPSQCYHFEPNPLHVLFNTNCPEALRQKVQDIIAHHVDDLQISQEILKK